MGYTVIYAPSNYELARTYRQFPDLVKAIIIEGADATKCFEDPKCIKTPTHPLGIPLWKMFSMHFWRGQSHPLGNAWTLSPENYPLFDAQNSAGNYYLGYSIERACREIPITMPDVRPRQAYVLAKRLSYFYNGDFAWPNISLVPPPELDISLVGGIGDDTDHHSPIPEGINNLGVLPKHQFYEELGRSRALVGIGLPFLSPSPYDALCMGVPFINPIAYWDEEHPDDRVRWSSQHDALKFENPPYVYNVRSGDAQALWKAIHDALSNPIDRYIPADMTMDALKLRLGNLIEADWRGKAEAILQQRNETGNSELFEL
ncbi:hypothetical protein HGRIS_006831 [Hohenbuehelia grisea]|uniref:alpha-1,6-mannosyl-glycoprotein 6-beta-N-acetylglucosaminyltransferase n=1 Tax=Hohenbuehelia grisea TaxID=104357 RepID=A0ABR3JAQ6_9AGAR